jgi:hypothetical protein
VSNANNLTQGWLERSSEAQASKKGRALSERHDEGIVLQQTRAILAYTITAGFFGFLILLIFLRPPDSNLAMLNIVLGSLGTAWLGAMAYFFGATANHRTGSLADRRPKESSSSSQLQWGHRRGPD